jgi:dTDP-4-amino-4,6-dideoxygalactose transaminase
VISKKASRREDFERTLIPYRNARSAFADFMRALRVGSDDAVLLPSYVGWSSREGSGVFDPVRDLGVRFDFYSVNDRLSIDLEHYERQLQRLKPTIVVLIHYFGWPDPSLLDAASLAREHHAVVLEDGAHAMFSDVIGGVVGRVGDACLWSLHKMLPVPAGGVLVLNAGARHLISGLNGTSTWPEDPWQFDLAKMAIQRRKNAALVGQLLPSVAEHVQSLRDSVPDGVVPQTLPVLILRADRDRLYEALNAQGFGVVALYHTLIHEIGPDRFPEAHRLSRRILNLPIHESASEEDLGRLVAAIGRLSAGLPRRRESG